MTSDFGAVLQRHRERLGWTQEQLAAAAELSAEAISALERGSRRFPQKQTIERLTRALHLTGAELEEFVSAVPRAVRRRSGERAPAVPRQLPAAVPGFSGRKEQLGQLTDLLRRPTDRSTPAVAAISGMGGIGKTALAVQVASAVSDEYPDGQLYLDLRGYGGDHPVSRSEALGYLLRALGTPSDEVPLDPDEASARFRSAVAARRLLMVIDNVRDVAQARALLPGTAGSAVIVTSRRSLTGLPGAVHIHLDALSAADGRQMLRTIIGGRRFDEDHRAGSEVVRLCGSLPLAIGIAGARLAARPQWPVAHLVQRLESERTRLDELERDDTGVRASFAVSVEQLIASTNLEDRYAAEAFTLLGVPDGPDVSLPVAARLIDRSMPDTERTLERLVDLHLLEAPAPERYRLHDLLRVYAREQALSSLPASARADALTRVLRLYAGAAWRTLSLMLPGSRSRLPWGDGDWTESSPAFDHAGQAVGWLEDHRPHLVSAVRQGVSGPGRPRELGIRLEAGLFGYYATRRHWVDWEETASMALDVADPSSDPITVGMLRVDLGLAQARLAESGSGSFDDAIRQLRHGLEIFRRIGDRQRESMCLINLTLVLRLAGRFDEAVACGEAALALARELDDVSGEVAARANVGPAYGGRGDHQQELAHLLHGRTLAARINSDHVLAEVHQLLAGAFRSAGAHDQALTELRASARVFRHSGDPLGAASALDELGALRLEIGDHAGAERDLNQALAIAVQSDDDGRCTARIQHHLGLALRGLGRLDEAATELDAALSGYGRLNMAAAEEVRAILADLG